MKLACNLQCCEKKKKKTYEIVGFVILLENFYSKKKNKIKEDPMCLLYIYNLIFWYNGIWTMNVFVKKKKMSINWVTKL